MELVIVVALISLLAGLSISSYMGYVEKARVVRATAEIDGISRILDAIKTDDDATLPESLAEIDTGIHDDPWGHPYQYLRIQVSSPGGGGGSSPDIGLARKDAFLVPINSDYDLYSMGADGDSRAPLRAPVSQDDIIRANDGDYIGLASLY